MLQIIALSFAHKPGDVNRIRISFILEMRKQAQVS